MKPLTAASYAIRSADKSSAWRTAGLLGLAGMTAAAVAVRLRTRAAEEENPPCGQFIKVDGVRLHYIERGPRDAQPLVLLHGDGSLVQDFLVSGLFDRAAEKYRVIAFDRPGYGYSERPDGQIWGPHAQAALLQHALLTLGVERPVVLGHSWGTLAALAMALDFPDYPHSLVLLSGYYYPTARPEVPLMALPGIPVLGALLRNTVSPLYSRLLWPTLIRRLFAPAPVPARFEAFPEELVLRPSQLQAAGAEAGMLIPAAAALSRRYRELNLPVVIMSGADDQFVDPHVHSARLHAELPQSDLHLRDGAGHMLHHVVPDEVLEAIDQAAGASALDLEIEHLDFPAEPMQLS
ncbi:alpha/beta hydrolase [Oxalobacteraceae bacterium OM1]|nr:alpha/beta hydrolase [Oxalobacteraceae bacterium OM1]